MTACRIPSGVQWSVGRKTLTVVGGDGVTKTLGYPDAAVWDFLSRGYSVSDVTRLVAAVASLEPAAAEELVRAAVAEWVECGVLERA